jgi:hypothetical protein
MSSASPAEASFAAEAEFNAGAANPMPGALDRGLFGFVVSAYDLHSSGRMS